MDDIYIIHKDKQYLQKLLSEIMEIAKQEGIFINTKKTHIVKLSHGFTFMQIKYNITSTNKIIRRMRPNAIARERNKLKAKARLVSEGILTAKQCRMDYRSWRGNAVKFKNWRSIRSLDILCDNLYGKTYTYIEELMKETEYRHHD